MSPVFLPFNANLTSIKRLARPSIYKSHISCFLTNGKKVTKLDTYFPSIVSWILSGQLLRIPGFNLLQCKMNKFELYIRLLMSL